MPDDWELLPFIPAGERGLAFPDNALDGAEPLCQPVSHFFQVRRGGEGDHVAESEDQKLIALLQFQSPPRFRWYYDLPFLAQSRQTVKFSIYCTMVDHDLYSLSPTSRKGNTSSIAFPR